MRRAKLTRWTTFIPSARKQSHTRVTKSKGKVLLKTVKYQWVANMENSTFSFIKWRDSFGRN